MSFLKTGLRSWYDWFEAVFLGERKKASVIWSGFTVGKRVVVIKIVRTYEKKWALVQH
jgi:hypothetical protein